MARPAAFNSILFVLYSLFIRVSFALDTRSCYNVTNGVESTHRPCISPESKATSHCCSLNDQCLGDTLCLSQFGTLYVGSCTVEDWVGGANGKGDCPKYCSDWVLKKTSADIALCDYNDGWNFCCGALAGIDKCCSGTKFQIQNTTNQFSVERPWNSNSTEEPTTPSPNATEPLTTESHCPAPEKAQTSKTAEIGIGVGLGIPLLMALGLLAWVEAKRRAAVAQLAPSVSEQDTIHSQGHQYDGGYVMAYSQVPRSELPDKAATYEMGVEDRGTTTNYAELGR